ncbi:MAG: acetate uptake transporter [Coriobacteriales bacterium]|jgi:succinate-acetate transporter protein|nr:acetate uptake transporter [Coriobacteriales bacterium]
MSSETSNVKQVYADGTALGLFSLGLATFVGSASLFTNGAADAPAIAWILCVAAFAQIWAAIMAFKSDNIFGGTVFGAYGLFWFGNGLMTIFASKGFPLGGLAGGNELFYICIAYLIFSIIATIAALKTNKLLVLVVGLIAVLFLGLTLLTSTSNADAGIAVAGKWIADISRIVLAIVSFYAVAAFFLNAMFGKTILPVGE